MIALNMRLTARAGRENELASAILERWMPALAEQPGFVHAALLSPYRGEAAAAVGLPEAEFTCDVISFWESEEQRAAWAASDLHARVIAFVNDAIEPGGGKAATLSNVDRRWQAG